MRWLLLAAVACFGVAIALGAPAGLVASLCLAFVGVGMVLDDAPVVEARDELAPLRAWAEQEPSWMPAVTRARERYMAEEITQEEFLKLVEEAHPPSDEYDRLKYWYGDRPLSEYGMQTKGKDDEEAPPRRDLDLVCGRVHYGTQIMWNKQRAVWQRGDETLYAGIPSFRALNEAERIELGFEVDNPNRDEYDRWIEKHYGKERR